MTPHYQIRDPTSYDHYYWHDVTHTEFVELLRAQTLGFRANMAYMEKDEKNLVVGKDGVGFRIGKE